MEFLLNYSVPVISGICLCLGYIVKKWVKDVENKYIPTLCGLVGLVLAVWINSTISADVILEGLFSGLAATGMHEAFTQIVEKLDEDK